MKKLLLGALLMLLATLLVAVVILRFGLVPVSADGTHSRLEARIMPVVLHAAVSRQAPTAKTLTPVSDEARQSGMHTYKAVCATCHGTFNGKPSEYGQAFYPPAPTFSQGLPAYKETELFWIIKHGIRNTGMPAWGGTLSDEEIWQVVAVLKQ
jgi:mono/diheme cytochrome c family protein